MGKRLVWLVVLILSLPIACTIAFAGVMVQSFTVTTSGPASGLLTRIGPPTTNQSVTTWQVTVDLATLGTLPASVVINFPDRAYATLTRGRSQQRGAGAFLWTGTGDGCSAVFTVAPVGLRGSVSCLDTLYGMEPAPDGSGLQLTRYDQPTTGLPAKTEDAPPGNLPAVVPNQTPVTPNNPPDTAIDILVLYSEATRQMLDPNGGKAATVAFAQYCVDMTQQAMDLSTTPTIPPAPPPPPIAMVHMVAAKEVSRVDAVPDIFADQRYLESNPEPIGLRNLWAADAVVYLIENGGNYYGASQVPGSTAPPNLQTPLPGPGFAPLAVAVVQRNTAVSDETGLNPLEPFVFMHEFAHLIGANHNHEDATNNTTPLEVGAYGRWESHADGGGQRTIMSYWRPPTQCAAPCARVPYYSNPSIYAYGDWFRTGVANYADNAHLINDYASYMAQYRPSLGRIFYDGFDDYSP